MAQGIRELKRRIKSVGNSKQITRAMQAVAASKMKRASDAAVGARPYALKSLELLSAIKAGVSEFSHPLLTEREPRNIAIIVFTTDKGLCGGLNTNTLKKATEAIASEQTNHPDAQIHLISVGRKGTEHWDRVNQPTTKQITNLSEGANITEIRDLTESTVSDFIAKSIDKVLLVYPNFISTISQKPQIKTLLPLSEDIIQDIAELSDKEIDADAARYKEFDVEYTLEPSPEKLLNSLLPRLVEMQLYRALLESNASEHSARMIAMKNATDNASDILDDLQLTYNKARQSAITKEITEIVGGVEALKERED